MKVHDKIKYHRQKKGLSQHDLAGLADIHVTNVSRLENGHYKPSFDLLKKLVEILDVSADYLLNDKMGNTEDNSEDQSLAKKIHLVETLQENEKKAVVEVIDAMLIKKKMREMLQENSVTKK